MAAPRTTAAGPPPVELIEEAVHLLRRHPAELGTYYAGTGAFALGLLYFWAYTTWFAPSDGAVAWGAFLLALLFGAMKAAQHHYARRLLAHRLGEMPPQFRWRDFPAEVAAQLRLHASAVVVLPLAVVFAVPFGWLYAYYQNATVLSPAAGTGGTAGCRRRAWELALLWPVQNHVGLAILGTLGLAIFINVAVAFYMVPGLATTLLGLKTIFAMTGWSYFNTTFLVLVTTLAYLLADPLVKSFYVLRVFYGESRRTGADLRLVLAREKSPRRLSPGLVALALAALLLGPPPARATEPAAPAPRALSAPLLDRSLDRVLEQPEFRWRLRPLPAPPGTEPDGVIKGFVRSSFDTIREIFRAVVRWVDRFRRWMADLLPDRERGEGAGRTNAGGSFQWMAALQILAALLLGGVVLLLVFVALKIWRFNREAAALAPLSAAVPASAPDLRHENVEASRLPAEGWLDLARQQIAAGEWRLALRALFLATLARLAHERLVTLAKFKTNLDYERELVRRAQGNETLVGNFRVKRREFEDVWYGATPAEAGRVNDWLRQLEGPA